MLNQGWRDQWDRVNRRLADVRAISGPGFPGGTVAAVDTVQAFFESIHHLKDWLGSDPAANVTKADGDALIKKITALQISADLANGTKHLLLTRTRTGDLSTTLGRNDVTVLVGTGRSSHTFYVQSNNQESTVLDVAEAGVQAWEAFLQGRNLV